MIKGVNKKIIEINNPDSIYFEKAIFYLKPNVRILSEDISLSEVSRYISEIDPGSGRKKRSPKTGRIIVALCLLAALTAVAICLIK